MWASGVKEGQREKHFEASHHFLTRTFAAWARSSRKESIDGSGSFLTFLLYRQSVICLDNLLLGFEEPRKQSVPQAGDSRNYGESDKVFSSFSSVTASCGEMSFTQEFTPMFQFCPWIGESLGCRMIANKSDCVVDRSHQAPSRQHSSS